MPSENVHKRQAEHNRRFLDWLDLDVTQYLDWAVTVIFYTALHFVEWLLATKGLHSDTHDNRHQAMGRVSELRPIYPDYRELETQSHRSRYEGAQFSRNFVKSTLAPKLEKIESHIRASVP
jgi:uncharacterized protein (UPF0332 family)